MTSVRPSPGTADARAAWSAANSGSPPSRSPPPGRAPASSTAIAPDSLPERPTMAMRTLGQIDHDCATLPDVSSDYLRLGLEIEPGVNPVTGRLADPRGIPTPFAGWAELIRAIER